MLELGNSVDFFAKCETSTSLFNRAFAEQDSDWSLIKNLYDNLDLNPIDNPIPRVIHFIWLGRPLPDWYKTNIDDWSQKNPKFDIIIWDNDSSDKFIKTKPSYDIFRNSKSFGIKSDVLRYEILKQEGGLYVDTDFLCLSSNFDILHDSFSFYAGICLEQPVQLNNGIMASAPNHPILDICIDNVSEDTFMDVQCAQTRVLYQTGPWLLTSALMYYLKNISTDHIFVPPSQTFHPFPARFRDDATSDLITQFLKPWSMACHLWHASWQPNSKFYVGEML
jgi:mannosyltransferase OCH1-like enzyme